MRAAQSVLRCCPSRAWFHHYDVEVSGSDGEPRQVELIGPVAQVFTYSIAAGLMVAGPALALTGDSLWDGLCPTIVTFPIGLAIAVTTYGERWNAKRFRNAGVVSTAEIVAVRIRQGGENPDVAELRVRISGPGFDTFAADCEVPAVLPLPRIGDRRQVVVDPSDYTFAIGYDHLFESD
ncbi:hypothetical protein AB0L57_01020 [Nocardia sp. NPDC052254]|uniref:hypothetical protein n=1 Tax=Nocardia sp. NPDC052254 TaxID=3155681 RepID=UPI00342AD5AA